MGKPTSHTVGIADRGGTRLSYSETGRAERGGPRKYIGPPARNQTAGTNAMWRVAGRVPALGARGAIGTTAKGLCKGGVDVTHEGQPAP